MINFALVGCGHMARWHAEMIQAQPEANVIALVDRDPDRTRDFRERLFPNAREFHDYDAFLRDPPSKVDAVVLITPHTLHYPMARLALEQGVHVLLEKPMVTRLPHALDLQRAVRRTGRFIAITFQAPYTQEYRYLAHLRDSGEWGKPQMVSGWMSQNWLTTSRDTWRQQPALSGGGQLYDSGAHLLNAMMWLTNEPVVEVGCFCDNAGSPVDVNGVVIVRFQSGTLGSIAVGGNCPAFRYGLQIQTDRYLIETDQYGSKLEMHTVDGRRFYPPIPFDPRGRPAHSPHANFVNAIRNKEPLIVPVRYGVLLSALMDAIYESASTGTMVRVDPAAYEL
jgi:predicted dehydrogenase